jgi:hypothetical protein
MKNTFNYNQDVLIFTHIPKCGGTSLHSILNRALNGKYIHFFPGSYENLNLLEYFGGGGHQNYNTNPLRNIGRNVRHITLLREPISRFFSFYNHVGEHREHCLHQIFEDSASPKEFAIKCYELGNYEISNLQTKMVTGNKNASSDEAIFHVKNYYSVYGCLERLDEFILNLSFFLGVKIDSPLVLNKAKTTRLITVDEKNEAIEYIKIINKQDIKLYSYFFG